MSKSIIFVKISLNFKYVKFDFYSLEKIVLNLGCAQNIVIIVVQVL